MAFAFLVASGADKLAPPLHVVITANDMMKFSVSRIVASPGQEIQLELKNTGTQPKEVMAHNWILLKADCDVAAYAAAASAAQPEAYQPKARADCVLASTPMLGARQHAEITFTAPSVPGHYPFLCTFPAHYQVGMKGELVVQ